MKPIAEVRPSPIAGLWYSGKPQQLALEMQRYLDAASLPVLEGKVIALIAPHAGHRYSGRTAGHAYRAIYRQSYPLVVVVSPLHAYYPAAVLTSAHARYATPLGEIEVDQQTVNELADLLTTAGLALTPIANDDEHSIEIQLPFLQQALAGSFKLLPLMVRSKDEKLVQVLGSTLAEVVRDRSALLVASTDLSHFHTLAEANALDGEMLRQIENFSPAGVLHAEQKGSGFACGAGAVAVVLEAARLLGGNQVKILHYSTSAEETGDSGSVVGYGAALVLRRE